MQTIELQRKWDLTLSEVEKLRRKYGGSFGTQRHKIVRDFRRRILRVEPMELVTLHKNIVTNQGLNNVLTGYLDGGTQIATWYVTLSSTNTTPLSTHTYSSPGYTEITTTNVDEAVRQAWTGGTAASQSIDNSAAPAVYIGDNAFTAYGAALVGGGSSPTVLANTAGGGILYASALFSSAKAMDVDVQLSTTYTFTSADDGV